MLRAFNEKAFELPDFDAVNPSSILDRALAVAGPKKTSEDEHQEKLTKINKNVGAFQEVAQDEVLRRVTDRIKHPIGQLPEVHDGLWERYDLVDKLFQTSESISTGPEGRTDCLPPLEAIYDTPPGFHLGKHSTFEEDSLIKKIRHTDFEEVQAISPSQQPTKVHSDPSAKEIFLDSDLWLPADGVAAKGARWNDKRFQFEASQPDGLTQRPYKRFLTIGTLQRRIRWCVEEIHTSRFNAEEATVPELFALAGGLHNILSWTSTTLPLLSHRKTSLIRSCAELEDLEVVLTDLSELLACDLSQEPPFTAFQILLRGASSRSSGSSKYSGKRHGAHILSLLHVHLTASVETGQSHVLIGSLRYLLDVTTRAWLRGASSWIGWPSVQREQHRHELEDQIASSLEGRIDARNHLEAKATGVGKQAFSFEPWAGMEVEWSWDDRQELDVGYTLRPARLPSFLPISHARDLLEGGRALRLLHRAAPAGHPLVALFERQLSALSPSTSRLALPAPRWIFNKDETAAYLIAVEQRINEMHREISAWRRYYEAEDHDIEAHMELDGQKSRLGREHYSPSSKVSSTIDLDGALTLYDQVPESQVRPDGETELAESLKGKSLERFIRESCHEADIDSHARSVSQSMIDSALTPLLRWSRLVNASLISVFFRDLYLGEYLDVCHNFMLLGAPRFLQQVSEVLFDDASTLSSSHDTVSCTKGVGLSQMLRVAEAWPPMGSTLNNALNSVIYEGIEVQQRQVAAMDLSRHGTSSASKLQSLDLDSRLSFAIVKPESFAGDCDIDGVYALDWLAISFQPPPLIAPLITMQAQTYYQRIFRFILRLMRITSTLKSVYRRLFDRRSGYPNLPAWMDGWDIERAERFRYEAHHFVSVLLRHSTDMIVGQRWRTFRQRLHALKKSCEANEVRIDAKDQVTDASGYRNDEVTSYRNGGSELGTELEGRYDDEGTIAQDGSDVESAQNRSRDFEVKDVFSIAAFHERTLDRMLAGCFLKARQRSIMTIIMDMGNMILKFARLIVGDDRGPTDAFENSSSLETILASFQSKKKLLLHALELVGQQAMKDNVQPDGDGQKMRVVSEQVRTAATSHRPHRKRQASAPAIARQAAVAAEIERQEAETRRDLEQLEKSDRKESLGDLEETQALIAALRGD
jgi:hypothetical protein